MKKICPKCNYENNEGDFYCSNCQTELRQHTDAHSDITYYNISNMSSIGKKVLLDGTYTSEEISVGAWIGITIAMGIPILNLIVLAIILWRSTNSSLRNFAIAQFILIGIGLVLMLIGLIL